MSALDLYRPEALEAILAKLPAGACLGIDELAGALPYPRHSLAGMLAALVVDGTVERVEQGCFQRVAGPYEPLQANGVRPDLQGPARPRTDLQRRLWRAIRLRKKFSVGDLIVLASREGEPSSRNTAYRYVRALGSAGYLSPLPRARAPLGPKRWLLVRDTGSAAPILLVEQGQTYVTDPNTAERVPCKR
ncbi:hypothetical protein [Inquilinus sp. CA228]|uniref:hypothetical protein n=1 Tax=Inquilinus sp. CA228 TaxID=3455609 RepID=UPI003F8D224F